MLPRKPTQLRLIVLTSARLTTNHLDDVRQRRITPLTRALLPGRVLVGGFSVHLNFEGLVVMPMAVDRLLIVLFPRRRKGKWCSNTLLLFVGRLTTTIDSLCVEAAQMSRTSRPRRLLPEKLTFGRLHFSSGYFRRRNIRKRTGPPRGRRIARLSIERNHSTSLLPRREQSHRVDLLRHSLINRSIQQRRPRLQTMRRRRIQPNTPLISPLRKCPLFNPPPFTALYISGDNFCFSENYA